MKIKTILLLTILLISSCIKDNTVGFKGNYDGYSIDSIEVTYNKIVNEPVLIKPIVKIDHIDNEEDLEYYWTMCALTAGAVSDTIWAKNLDMLLPGKYGEAISCAFVVRDKMRDIRYRKSTTIYANSNFKTGYTLLGEKDGMGFLSFITADNEEIYYDLHPGMPKGKRLGYFSGSKDSAVGVLLEEKPEESFFLEGKNLSYFCTFADLYKTLDYVDGVFAPVNLSGHVTNLLYGNMFILANKKIYVKPGSLKLVSSFFGAPVDGDYESGEFYGSCGGSGQFFVTYDYKNKRYIYVSSSDVTTVKTFATPIEEGYAFDMSNVDVTPVWMGYSNPTEYSSSYFVAIVKNNTTQNYQLHEISIVDERVEGIRGDYVKRVISYDLPENIYNPSCPVCTSSDVMYIANGKTIYRLSLEVFGNIEPIAEMENPISCMRYSGGQTITVITESEDGDYPSNLLEVSTWTEDLGEIITTIDSVGIKVKDVIYKTQ